MDYDHKRCTGCHKVKHVDCFGNDKSRNDGKYPYCTVCRAERKQRYYNPVKQKAYNDAYRARTRDKLPTNAANQKKWKLKNKAKRLAHKAVELALNAGRLFRSPHCMTCGITCKTEAHHWKGYEPKYHLDVIWLCPTCHGMHDRLIRHNQVWPYDTIRIVEFPVVSYPIDFNKE